MRSRRIPAGVVAVLALIGAAFGDEAACETPSPPRDIILSATGSGLPPKDAAGAQARLMAERAAVVTALRNLAVKLGHSITDTKTGAVKVEAFLAGYRLAERKYNEDGSVEATVVISLDQVYGSAAKRLKAQLAEARARNAALQAKVAALQETVARLRQAAANRKAEIDDLKKRIAELEAQRP